MQLPFFLLFRITVSVLIAFWLIHRISPVIRAAVVRAMPMRIRISDKSFTYQARFTTLVSIILGTLVAGGLYWGLTDLTRGLAASTTPLPPAPVRDPVQPQDTPDRDSVMAAPIELSTAPPESPDPKPEPAPVVIAPAPKPAPEPVRITSESYFLQVHAYEDKENAWMQQASLERRLRRRVWVADAGREYAPYKVLIGPFADRSSAAAYRRQKRLEGFPRALGDMHLYAH